MTESQEKLTVTSYLEIEENWLKLKAAIAEKGFDSEKNIVLFNRKAKQNIYMMPVGLQGVVNTEKNNGARASIAVLLTSLEKEFKNVPKGQELQGVAMDTFLSDIKSTFEQMETDEDDVPVLIGLENTSENEKYFPTNHILVSIDGKSFKMTGIQNMTFMEVNNKKENDPNLIVLTFS